METDQTVEGQIEMPVEEPGTDEMPASEVEGELPEEASERTRREFEKLKETNRILAEKAAKYEKFEAKNALEDVFGNINRGAMPTPQPPSSQDFIDEQGNVDVRGLNEALARANYTAQQAQALAQQTAQLAKKQAEEYQIREAHSKHPWMDPTSEQFDEDSYNLVKDRLVRLWSEGKDTRLVDVADQVATRYRKVEAPKEPEVSTSKAHSASVQRGHGQARAPKVDVGELRARASAGDLSAVDALIKLATE